MQVGDVSAARGVDGHALAAADVADDPLAPDRVATSGPEYHEPVDAAHLDAVLTAPEDAAHHRRDLSFRRTFPQLLLRHDLAEHQARGQLAVSHRRQQFVGSAAAVLLGDLDHPVALEELFSVQPEAPRFLLEDAASELDAAGLLRCLDEVADLVPRAGGDDETEPVAARVVVRLRDDFDDVAVFQLRTERHHLAVDPGADAAMADVGVDGVREVDESRAAGQRLHFAFRREGVDLLGVEVQLQVLDELLRVADLHLELEELSHPRK